MSKQLSVSAAFAVFAMAAFALTAAPLAERAREVSAPASANAPTLYASFEG